jgi:hypothetical protein
MDVRIFKGIIGVVADGRNPKRCSCTGSGKELRYMTKLSTKFLKVPMLLNLAAPVLSHIKDAQRFCHLRDSRLVCTASSGRSLILSGLLSSLSQANIPFSGRTCFIRGIQSSRCCAWILFLQKKGIHRGEAM